MTITTEQLKKWLVANSETEHLEFKEAKNNFHFEELVNYCVALANEGGGHIVFGVSDKLPRQVVGTTVFDPPAKTAGGIYERLHIKVTATELEYEGSRVLVISVPSRPIGKPIEYKGRYLMRAGEELVPITPDFLQKIFSEGQQVFEARIACTGLSAEDVVRLLDTQSYFDLTELPYPADREGVISRFICERLLINNGEGIIQSQTLVLYYLPRTLMSLKRWRVNQCVLPLMTGTISFKLAVILLVKRVMRLAFRG